MRRGYPYLAHIIAASEFAEFWLKSSAESITKILVFNIILLRHWEAMGGIIRTYPYEQLLKTLVLI